MKIKLVEHNDSWKEDFKKIAKELKQKINRNINVEHIGSTAVAGIKSKPIIDILIGVHDHNLDNYIDPIKKIGFKYIDMYEDEIPNRRFFVKKKKSIITHHIHLVRKSSYWYSRHIAFRNKLIDNANTKKEYEKLKLKLAKIDWKDRNEYSEAKTFFIRKIERSLRENT